MKTTSLFLALLALAVTGCNTFEENLKESANSTTTQGMNTKQEAQVNDFAEGGQLNSYEEQQMMQSIDGN